MYLFDGSEKVITQPSAPEFLLKMAQKHNVIADALNFYREGKGFSLCKAYKIISKDQIITNGWTTKLRSVDLRRQLRVEMLSEILLDM